VCSDLPLTFLINFDLKTALSRPLFPQVFIKFINIFISKIFTFTVYFLKILGFTFIKPIDSFITSWRKNTFELIKSYKKIWMQTGGTHWILRRTQVSFFKIIIFSKLRRWRQFLLLTFFTWRSRCIKLCWRATWSIFLTSLLFCLFTFVILIRSIHNLFGNFIKRSFYQILIPGLCSPLLYFWDL